MLDALIVVAVTAVWVGFLALVGLLYRSRFRWLAYGLGGGWLVLTFVYGLWRPYPGF